MELFVPTFFVIFATSFNGAVLSLKFGDNCQHTSDCLADGHLKVTGVTCAWASSTCARGVCTCARGFIEDADAGQCRRVVKLNEDCRSDQGDQCEAENAVCHQGACRCSTGFKTGPRGDDCIPANMMPLRHGDSCYYRVALFHDAFCPYNLICTPKGCACPPGHRLSRNSNFECVKVKLGEPCAGDVDCSQNLHSMCGRDGRNSTCTCKPGYRVVRHRYGGEVRLRCARRDAKFLSEGDYCGDAYPFQTPFLALTSICSEPLTCIACSGTHSPTRVCGVQSKEEQPTSTALVKYEKRQRMLGERCDNMFRSECVLPNTDCINGICQCLPGSGCVFKDYETSAGVFDIRRSGALVGRSCSADSDCARDGSMVCQSVSSSCYRSLSLQPQSDQHGLPLFKGVCACAAPNYVERVHHVHDTGLKRDTVSICSKRLRLGEICSKSRTNGRGICSARNSDCLFGVCQCVQGYKMAPWGDECIPDEQIRYYGEKCLFSEECYYSSSFESPMACLDNTCLCLAGSRPGMSNPDGPAYGCIANRLGDRCMVDSDCHLYWRYNWHCNVKSQTCECNSGYYAAKLSLRDGEAAAHWCVPYNATLQTEGAACRQNIQDMDVGHVCAAPLVCSSCDDVYSRDGICGWPAPKLSDKPAGAHVTAWSKAGRADFKKCVALPIDDDLNLLLAPAHCFPGHHGQDQKDVDGQELKIDVYLQSVMGHNLTVAAESVLRHPAADIALLRYRIETAAPSSADVGFSLVQAIELPSPGYCDELINCTIVGYDEASSNVDVIPTAQCQQEYGLVKGAGTQVSQKTLCAGRYPNAAAERCEMETSPGPLVCRNPNGRPVVAGLALRLNQCAIAGMPRVFTRLCFSLEWINQARMILSSLQLLQNNESRCPRSSVGQRPGSPENRPKITATNN